MGISDFKIILCHSVLGEVSIMLDRKPLSTSNDTTASGDFLFQNPNDHHWEVLTGFCLKPQSAYGLSEPSSPFPVGHPGLFEFVGAGTQASDVSLSRVVRSFGHQVFDTVEINKLCGFRQFCWFPILHVHLILARG